MDHPSSHWGSGMKLADSILAGGLVASGAAGEHSVKVRQGYRNASVVEARVWGGIVRQRSARCQKRSGRPRTCSQESLEIAESTIPVALVCGGSRQESAFS